MLWWSVLDGQHRWEQVASLAKQLPRNHEKTWVRKRIIKVTNIHYQHFGSQLLNKRLLLLPSQAAPKPSLPGVSAWVCFKASTHGADLAAFITDFCCFTAYKRSKEVGSDPHSRKHSIFPALWKPKNSDADTVHVLVPFPCTPMSLTEILQSKFCLQTAGISDGFLLWNRSHAFTSCPGFSFPCTLSTYRKTLCFRYI